MHKKPCFVCSNDEINPCRVCRRRAKQRRGARAWIAKPENREKRQRYQKQYHDSHVVEEKAYRDTYEPDPEKTRASRRRYDIRHRAEVQVRRALRRAMKRNEGAHDLTGDQWLEIQATQDHRCYYCKKRFKDRLTQDHITPISLGGLHTLHNVIGACGSCNSGKRDRKPPIPVQPFLLTLAPARKAS